ncbi:MAG: glycoside hydrolase family 3, partial [Clostridia bacterium]|nr:glycoside hydrolase family 3 [Clostridia bacterium]
MKEFLALLVSAIMTLSGCTAAEDEAVVPTESIEESIDDAAVLQLLSQMTLDEKIYQMMFVTAESITGAKSVTAAGEATRTALEKYPVGGIIYFGSNIVSPEQVTQMITNTQSYSKIPLFIGVDEEGGRVA